jgi:hypothetical protein
MNENHKLALYVSYYLARFDKVAYEKLDFGNQSQTHHRIGELLSVKPSSVQNWRDEFDPLFGHRARWYQRPLSPSRVQVANALNNLPEQEVYLIVKRILTEQSYENPDLKILTEVVDETSENKDSRFILRAPTGKKAEEYFINYFKKEGKPHKGELVDTRDLGCGYDFEILKGANKYLIEVKGLSKQSGGILLTNKEWETAKSAGNTYYIALVSNLEEQPKVEFIRNPYEILLPKENIIKTIQVNWSVSAKQLKEYYEQPE